MKNIWLIDDDQAAHVYHTIMIRNAGLDLSRVHSFYGVDEAMERVMDLNQRCDHDEWPDYIFLDINMPVKTGYDFIDEISAVPLRYPFPEIHFVSSTKNPEDIHKFEQLDQVVGFETKFLEVEFFEDLLKKSQSF